jgi:hypothetical protein
MTALLQQPGRQHLLLPAVAAKREDADQSEAQATPEDAGPGTEQVEDAGQGTASVERDDIVQTDPPDLSAIPVPVPVWPWQILHAARSEL